MSFQSFEKAFELAPQCNDYDVGVGKPKAVIKLAEEKLGVTFSKQMNTYLQEYGYLEIFGHEFYGITKDDFSGKPAGNIVETAMVDREEFGLPPKWVPVYFLDDGYMAYQDYSNITENEEPPIIAAIYDGNKYVITETLAEDFGDFLLQMVSEQLENQ